MEIRRKYQNFAGVWDVEKMWFTKSFRVFSSWSRTKLTEFTIELLEPISTYDSIYFPVDDYHASL